MRLNNSREKLVLSIHLTLTRGEDDRFIELVRSAPRRQLARSVREVVRQGLKLQKVEPHARNPREMIHD